MGRISREQMFMDICEVIARRSTCGRGNVGAILVNPLTNNIVSIGYNGPPSGEPHCQGNSCEKTPEGGCARSLHAEANAIDRLPPSCRSLELSLYVTTSPCVNCAKRIIALSKIGRVYYRYEYRITDGIQMLIDAGVHVFKVTPAGYVLRKDTNEFVKKPEM